MSSFEEILNYRGNLPLYFSYMNKDICVLEERLGYTFKNKEHLFTALLHSSYSNESGLISNERFEFLGDAVLHLVITEYIFGIYRSEDEGALSALRSYCESAAMLSILAKRFGLGEFMMLGRGEETSGGRTKSALLADAAEAVIAAIYLDGGYTAASLFVLSHLRDDIREAHDNLLYLDAKSELQILSQKKFGAMPSYRLLSQSGLEHKKVFEMSVTLKEFSAVGYGSNKKESEKDAAAKLLKQLTSNLTVDA